MAKHPNEPEVDWHALSEEVRANHRPHAGFFSWETNRELAEWGVLQEFQNALAQQDELFFYSATHRGFGNDPPDCEAIGSNRRKVGIEITELVDSDSAAAARAGKSYDWKDWRGCLIQELTKILLKKDSPSAIKGLPYDEYVLVIFSDEPWLDHQFVKEQLEKHEFPRTRLITKAFLLLSYSPFTQSYPCFEIRISGSPWRAVKILIILIWWPLFSFEYWYTGHPVIAAFFVLPFVAILLFHIYPYGGPGRFALFEELVPIEKQGEKPSTHALRLIYLWAIGALALPVSLVTLIINSELLSNEDWYGGFVVFIGPIFGIACLIKTIAQLIIYTKLKREEATLNS